MNYDTGCEVELLIKAQGEAECFIIQETHTPSAINHIKHSCIDMYRVSCVGRLLAFSGTFSIL